MATPESLVYRGREGTGLAQVFGREGDPMGAYKQRKAEIEYKRAVEAEKAKLAKEKRDKDLWALINVDPDKAFEPFQKQVADSANKLRENITKEVELTGGNITDQIRLKAKRGWDEVNTLAAKTHFVKNTLSETKAAIEKDPYLDYSYYFPKLNDIYMDEKGNAKSVDEIDVDAIKNIHISDTGGWNEKKFFKDFLDGLNENMSSYVTQKATNNGILTEEVEAKWKGDLYSADPNSSIGVRVDKDGNPILNITQDLINAITSSDTARRALQAEADRRGIDLEEVVREKIAPRAGLKVDKKPSFSRDMNWISNTPNQFGLKPSEVNLATNRATKIKNLINGVGADGSVSPDAQSALGALINAKFGDGHILNAQIIPANNTPGTVEVFPGTVVNNSPHPRVVLRVKYSDRGFPKAEEIQLDNESAFEALNGIMQTSQAEGGKKFSTDQLMGVMGWNDLSKLYEDNQGLSKVNEAAKQAEVSLLNKINSYGVNEDIPELVGRYADGMKITAANRRVTEPGWSPGLFGKPWGQKEGVEIELTDSKGKKIYKIVSEEELTKIVRGEGATKLKNSYKMEGKSISIEDLRKAYSDEEIQQAIEEGILE